jgi:hypothetical protein
MRRAGKALWSCRWWRQVGRGGAWFLLSGAYRSMRQFSVALIFHAALKYIFLGLSSRVNKRSMESQRV